MTKTLQFTNLCTSSTSYQNRCPFRLRHVHHAAAPKTPNVFARDGRHQRVANHTIVHAQPTWQQTYNYEDGWGGGARDKGPGAGDINPPALDPFSELLNTCSQALWGFVAMLANLVSGMLAGVLPSTAPRSVVDTTSKWLLMLVALLLLKGFLSIILAAGSLGLVLYVASQWVIGMQGNYSASPASATSRGPFANPGNTPYARTRASSGPYPSPGPYSSAQGYQQGPGSDASYQQAGNAEAPWQQQQQQQQQQAPYRDRAGYGPAASSGAASSSQGYSGAAQYGRTGPVRGPAGSDVIDVYFN